jgi:membrane peptidoglycan carboxypeptidase
MRRPRPFAVTLVSLTLLASGCATGTQIEEEALAPKIQSTKIFAADGSLITILKHEENREIIPIEDIPRHVRDAVVAIEDARFYSHKGLDARAIMRALYVNATSGRILEGGSTITQQLVRNSLESVGTEQTLQRKLREASVAYRVDASFSKEKILELYLNTVYFGEGAYGIQTASQTYFGKNVEDLKLAEASLLAGLIRAPVTYNPYTDAEVALNRRNRVLDRMFVNNFASRRDVAKAKGAPVGVREKVEGLRYPHPYFVDYVTRLIQKDPYGEFAEFGETATERSNALFRGGLRIHTTIDPKIQAAAEESINKVLDHPESDPSASLVAIDPKNGHIKALVGGRDFFAPVEEDPCARFGAVNADGSPKTCAKVNLALGSQGGGSGRQPGSAFKPFTLAVALENGVRLTDTYAAPSCIRIPGADAGGAPWNVCNYEETSFGSRVTVREGTVKSINTVYAQMIVRAGGGDPRKAAGEVVDLAKRMGMRSNLEPPVPSISIGTKSVSPLDMATAFSVFPNLGEYVEPIAITKITDATGEIVWAPQQEREQVLNPAIAYLVTQTLEEVIARGTGARYGRIGRPAFGKTGTSQEWRDAWWVGGAGTDLVAAVSVFWPDGEISMKSACGQERTSYAIQDGVVIPPTCRPTRIRVVGGSWPTQIWQVFMLKALEGVPASSFEIPEVATVRVAIDITRGCLPNPYTPDDLIRAVEFIKGTEPTKTCTEPTGPEVADVPSVVGFPVREATKLLRQAGFVVEEHAEYSDLFPPGRVLRQSPQAGTEAGAGTAVGIWVSTGGTEVPDVVNSTEKEARSALENRGFRVHVARQDGCKPNESRCRVWDQDPDGGTRAASGSTVTIFVKRR